jgi:outer membrane receptor protein involved in Fe transport
MSITRKLLPTLLASVSVNTAAFPIIASAQQDIVADFDIPSQPMETTLRTIAQASGLEVLYDAQEIEDLVAPAIKGRMTGPQALAVLEQTSPLQIEYAQGSAVVHKRAHAVGAAPSDGQSEAIIVTGTRIAGAEPSASVITLSKEAMRDAGQYQLGDVVRSVPQNFNGGQNPGVLAGSPTAADLNVNSATGVNLRGLGADATLTLLNGKRLAYDSGIESIDISAIPMAAVERVEILTEGASAIYGSDAVAGVVNVILQRDFEGLDLSARLGAATDGGDVEQQYSAVTGGRWNNGGFLIAAETGQNTSIKAGERSYGSNLNHSTTLLPEQKHHAIALTGHQQVSQDLTFDLDALYNHRTSFFATALTPTADYRQSGFPTSSRLSSFVITPRLAWDFAKSWSVSLTGTYGEDKSSVATGYNAGGVRVSTSEARYANSILLGELNLAGSLFKLPGGEAKIAAGGGFRHNGLNSRLRTVTPTAIIPGTTFDEARKSTYVFAEANLPIVSPDNDVPGINRLTLTGALRHERYRAIGNVTTPKLGLVYAPVGAVTFRASWGKSFKAPTFRQLYLIQRGQIDLPSIYGASGSAGDTVLQLTGGNLDLDPEKAETWSTGVTVKPHFNTDYKDRVVTPIASRVGALSNPLYSSIITSDPTIAQVQSALALATGGLLNNSGRPFDPASVAYIIDNRSRNVARQEIQGVDLALEYHLKTRDIGDLQFSASVSYLKSRQQLLPGQAPEQLAGTVFRPPSWRARAGVAWQISELMFAGYVNYTDSLEDRRFGAIATVASMTTVDTNIRYEPHSTTLPGISFALSVLNIFNAKPDRIRTSSAFVPAFDSTNYSAIGRYVGFTVEKSW